MDECHHHYVPVRREPLGNGEFKQVQLCRDCGKQLDYEYDESTDKLFSRLMYDGGM